MPAQVMEPQVAEQDPIVDAEVIEEPVTTQTPAAPGGREIVRHERRSEVLRPLDIDTVLESFAEYQRLIQRILTPDDWQGKPNAEGSFVKKKGWRKIATAFDLDLKRVSSSVERDEHGNPLRAAACYVAVAPSGRSMDGDGYCAADEPRFQNAKGRQKLENDLQATATTRAKNRAISDLVGMGAVSAEEVDSSPQPVTAAPPYGPPAHPEQVTACRRAIGFLVHAEPDSNRVGLVLNEIMESAGGYLPHFALASIVRVALKAKAARTVADANTQIPGDGDPSQETAEECEERERAESIAAEAGA